MAKHLFIISIILFGSFSNAQVVFEKTFTANGRDIKQLADGGYILCGHSAIDSSAYIARLDQNGDTLWMRGYGNSGDDVFSSVDLTNDGGFILAGASDSFGAGFQPDCYLVKLDSLGNVQWSNSFGGSAWDQLFCVKQTNDNGYVMTGYTRSFGAGASDVYLAKTDSLGNLLWTKTFGGSNYDEAFALEQTFDNGFVISGYTKSFGAGASDVFVIKTDSLGNLAWTKTFGDIKNDECVSIKQTNDNGYIITGNTDSITIATNSAFLIKTNSLGDTLWAKRYSGMGANYVQQVSDGGYIITGGRESAACLMKTDSLGNMIWTRGYRSTTWMGLSDGGLVVHETSDLGFIVLAGTCYPPACYNSIYLIKTDQSGVSSCIDSVYYPFQSNFYPMVTSPALSISSGAIVYPALSNAHSISDSISTLCFGTIGFHEVQHEETFNIYPNPANETITISTKNFEDSSIQIFDLTGKLMLIEKLDQEEKQINIGKLSSGMYFVQIQNGKKFFGKKFVKE